MPGVQPSLAHMARYHACMSELLDSGGEGRSQEKSDDKTKISLLVVATLPTCPAQ